MFFGDDFAYNDAEDAYRFVETLSSEIMKRSDRYEFKFSSFQQYLSDLNKEYLSKPEFKVAVYTGDLFTHNQGYEHYWSGYYTARPQFKELVRDFVAFSETSTTMIAQLVLQGDTKSVDGLKETSNALQEHWSFLMHHDTITGTST